MRKIAILSLALFAAACGSSSDPVPTAESITGTVGGAAFTSASQLAMTKASNACEIALAPVPLGVSLALVNVSDVAGTCTQADQGCLSNSRNLQLFIAKVHVPNATFPNSDAPPFTTGTYTYADVANFDPTTLLPDPVTGNISIFTGAVEAFSTAPVCDTTGYYLISSGTMTVTSVAGSTISGTVSVNLVVPGTTTAAGTLSGTFTTANICTDTSGMTACQMLNGILPSVP
ncbi:MAG TPA: hypothetical protein PLL32_07915 [Anaeromyxobacteraceae bacterium]|nr:hypothetical protein [Anaeromyxobacteraceae bacterium]